MKFGSRILPVISNLTQGGNEFIQPFNGIEDAYNVYRGGSNAYALAFPVVSTAASLRTLHKPTFTSKFSNVIPDFIRESLTIMTTSSVGTLRRRFLRH